MSVILNEPSKTIVNSNLTFIICNTGTMNNNIFKSTTFQYYNTGSFSITNNLTGATNVSSNTINTYKGSQFTTVGNDIYYTTGKVGLGTTNPVQDLDIRGNIQTTNLYVTTGYIGVGKNDPSYQIDLSTDDARKLTTTTWLTGSDERVKENIEDADLDICYDIVKRLKLKRFRWKEDVYPLVGDRNNVGFIAQEVETVFPKAVVKNKQQFSRNIVYDDFRNLNADQIYKTMFGATQKLITKFENQNLTVEQGQNADILNGNYVVLTENSINSYNLPQQKNGRWMIITNLTENLVYINGNLKQYQHYKLEPNKSVWIHSNDDFWYIVNL